ncbi:hypothetical protein [Symbiopectobacterium purcellii]
MAILVVVMLLMQNEAAWRLQIEVWQNSDILKPASRRLSRVTFP